MILGPKVFRYTVAPEQEDDLNRALTPYLCDSGPGWISVPASSASEVAAILAQYNATVVDVIPNVSL